MMWFTIVFTYFVSLFLSYMVGLSVAQGRQAMKESNRQIEIQSALRNKKTDVVDRTYCFGRPDGYEMFKVNQN